MGETVNVCPVSKKDEFLGRTILEGYHFRDINQVPEDGGMGDQTILFVLGTQHLAERLKHFEREAHEKAMKTSQR